MVVNRKTEVVHQFPQELEDAYSEWNEALERDKQRLQSLIEEPTQDDSLSGFNEVFRHITKVLCAANESDGALVRLLEVKERYGQ